jgi:heme-degrading monooxygenase HmoA
MIRVIIERHIAETLEANYQDAALEILSASVRAPGFISGESLCDLDNPRHRIVLCKWRSRLDWDNWNNSLERKELMNKLSLMLEREESVTLLDSPH